MYHYILERERNKTMSRRSRRTRFVSTKKSKIAISSSSINHRIHILTGSHSCFRFHKRHLIKQIKKKHLGKKIIANSFLYKTYVKKKKNIQSHSLWICQCSYRWWRQLLLFHQTVRSNVSLYLSASPMLILQRRFSSASYRYYHLPSETVSAEPSD